MDVEIIAVFIPIIFLIGLFSVIALNIITKYNAKTLIANRVTSVDDWYKTEAQVKISVAQSAAQVKVVKAERRAARNRSITLRICGLVIGLGLGVFLGCMILVCGGIPEHTQFEEEAIATFTIISLAMICGGGGMIGAYLLERKLDSKTK